MPQVSEPLFHFHSQAAEPGTFEVVRFHGEEGLSQLYSFDILLVSQKTDVDLRSFLLQPATLVITGNQDYQFYVGILTSFEQLHQVGGWVFYRAVLRPKHWLLNQFHSNQIFLNQGLKEYLGVVLGSAGLSQGLDFDFKFTVDYSARDYLCQYRESHFAFVSRWMEREGAYYWFEQHEPTEMDIHRGGMHFHAAVPRTAKMMIADSKTAHTTIPGHDVCRYAPPTGLGEAATEEAVRSFSLKCTPLPHSLVLKDYNYEKPSVVLSSTATVGEKGQGEIYVYGENFKDAKTGDRLASVMAEGYACREQLFHGRSNIPALRTGYLFSLDRHYRADFNQQYLIVSVCHEGSQERYLTTGLGVKALSEKDGLYYRNSFECIPNSTQFRPPRTTDWPRIRGMLTARIDAAGSGQYAELDDQGRYKVILPFDRSGRKDGKASTFIRKMQPYGGQGMGLHAPLHKGTEVLLSFIDGDPDRPVIAGAIPNPETPSLVTDENCTNVMLTSAGGSKVQIEDLAGREHILLHSPTNSSSVRLGTPGEGMYGKIRNEVIKHLGIASGMVSGPVGGAEGMAGKDISGTISDEVIKHLGVVGGIVGGPVQGVEGLAGKIPGVNARGLAKGVGEVGKEAIGQAEDALGCGIQIHSAKGVETVAAAESKLITASSSEMVAGMASRYVLGWDSETIAGLADKKILGTETISHTTSVASGEGRLEGYALRHVSDIFLQQNVGTRQSWTGVSLDVHENNTQIFTTKQHLSEAEDGLVTRRSVGVEADTLIQGDAKRTAISNFEALEKSTRVMGVETSVSESETKTSASVTEFVEEKTQVGTQVTVVTDTNIALSELTMLG